MDYGIGGSIIMDDIITINKNELKQIVEVAFERGMDWVNEYKGWFIPTDEQTQNKMNDTYENILTTFQIVEDMKNK